MSLLLQLVGIIEVPAVQYIPTESERIVLDAWPKGLSMTSRVLANRTGLRQKTVRRALVSLERAKLARPRLCCGNNKTFWLRT